jgi:hypothetical protein
MTTHAPDSDFGTLQPYAPLRMAEQLVLRAWRGGDIAKIGLRLPESTARENSVRASFLVALLQAGLARHGQRLQLLGAVIDGRLDLGDAAIAGSLWFYRCRFDAPVLLDGAQVSGSVTFAGCHMAALLADRCEIGADLVLNAGTVITQDLRLSQARIGGDFDCARLDLGGQTDAPPPGRRALVAQGLSVEGDVRLCDGFQAVGEVRLTGARIGGDLRASGLFNGCPLAEGGRGPALRLDRAQIDGSVRLDHEFNAAGSVRLVRARIGDDLDATGASFDWLGDAGWSDSASLTLDRAHIGGALVLRELRTPLLGASFVGARVGSLADDASTWGQDLALDGFHYSRLGDDAPLDTRFRVGWLERQKPAHLGAQFRMQPWQRLIRVLRRMGHEHHARSVGERRERHLRRIGRIGAWAPPPLRWLPRAGHWLLGVLVGHGYRPGRLAAWMALMWLGSAAVYWAAGQWGGTSGAAGAGTVDAMADPLAYSLDRLLPLVALGQDDGPAAAHQAWAAAVRWLARLETSFGWLAGLLLLASLAGWMDRDRRA